MKNSLDDQLNQEFERFLELSTVLDRQTRKYLIQYMRNKLSPNSFTLPEIKDSYFQYFKKSLDDIFGMDNLLNIKKVNVDLTKQLMLDTLYWLRKTYHKVRSKHPYQTELDRLTNWSITPIKIFVNRWSVLINYLEVVYSEEDIALNFYRTRFKEIIQGRTYDAFQADEKERLDLILTDLLAQWDAKLNAKILQYQLEKLEEERQKYQDLVENKVNEFEKLSNILSPFSQYIGRQWDMSRALWQETSFDVVKTYDELLKNEKSIQELADLLGKLRQSEIEIEEETFEKTIIRQEWVVDEFSKAEIVGVHESDDLNHVLSSEIGLLADQDTETLFLKKYADKNLLTFKYEDQKLVKSEDKITEVYQRTKQKEKGPFIICVDTSESMDGRPEQIAKVLCLGILKMASKENRRAYLINFSTGIQTLDLLDIANSINEIAKFLKMSFYGGTDISLPLYEALKQLRTENYQDADVLVISDFIMYKIDDDVIDEVRHFQQNKNTQFHSLTLSNDPNARILKYFDTNWIYDPKQKGIIKELTRGLKTIAERY